MLSKDDVHAVLVKALVDLFEISPDRIRPEANIYEDLEIDSIDAIDLIDHIKKETGHKLMAEDFRTVRTLQDVVDAVMKKIDGSHS
ncbi:MAG: acyl carrier protein [Lautropia sp.]|nr:acyl carrier protein [Lautropia sp.]